jgi:hypothetical protein
MLNSRNWTLQLALLTKTAIRSCKYQFNSRESPWHNMKYLYKEQNTLPELHVALFYSLAQQLILQTVWVEFLVLIRTRPLPITQDKLEKKKQQKDSNCLKLRNCWNVISSSCFCNIVHEQSTNSKWITPSFLDISLSIPLLGIAVCCFKIYFPTQYKTIYELMYWSKNMQSLGNKVQTWISLMNLQGLFTLKWDSRILPEPKHAICWIYKF